MAPAAAKRGDLVRATDLHAVIPPSGGPPVSTPLPFAGRLDGGLSPDVVIEGEAAATVGSTATNAPVHILPPGSGTFAHLPTNQARVSGGSDSVLINGQPAARFGDPALTCNDPVDLPNGTISAQSSVVIG